MTTTIAKRLAAVRAEMAAANVDAFIVPRADEYLGEYVPASNERLLWLTDFSGSAGMAIILKETAAIFVDGRYTIQAKQQVDDGLYEIRNLTRAGQIPWLITQLNSTAQVGYDPRLHSLNWHNNTQSQLSSAGIKLVPMIDNPIDRHWQQRPLPANTSIMLFSDQNAGQNSLDKRKKIGKTIEDAGADLALISAVESFCWLLNIRGGDIPMLPVVLGVSLLHANGDITLFTDQNKLPVGIENHVGDGVSFREKADLTTALAELKGLKLLADPDAANAWILLSAQAHGAQLITAQDPVMLPKAQKNKIELAGMTACHIRDGLAVSRFLAWLDKEVEHGNLHHEGILADKLESFRRQDPNYREPSFDTISAAGANAAMCHYNHRNTNKPATITQGSLYLVDSGGQYLDGTTDVTRTIAIGKVNCEQRKMATLVLKGHIALAQARFPEGTTGQQLDSLARQYLWQHGFDYDHGTGHGVGHFLSVHEGPQRIAKNGSDVPLVSGMIISNEPGYYRADGFGIRIENLVVVRPCKALAEAQLPMYEFDSLTMIPIDVRLIDRQLLTLSEINWLNDYHQRVFNNLSPLIQGDELNWLTSATKAI